MSFINFPKMPFPRLAARAAACALLLLAPRAAHCASGLDQKKIHAEYNDGDFDGVINALEAFKKKNRTYSREDSVFVAKHLAVVYSANPNTREKGKYYMNLLLELVPSAKLVDMYVSDEIDRIFEKVREEFLTRQAAFGVDTADVTAPAKAPRNDSKQPAKPIAAGAKPEKDNHALYWVAGGAAAVAAGVAAYFVFSGEPASDKVYVVDKK